MPRPALTAASPPATMAERDDELRRLVLEIDQLEAKKAALQTRLKLLLGLGAAKKAQSRFTLDYLDSLARKK